MIAFRKATWRAKAARPLRARLDGGSRAAGDEGLGHFDIARARQVIEMRAEVAVGRAGQALEASEIEALLAWIKRGQRRHDAQADRLMDDFVRPVHRFRPAASRGRRG